MTHRRDRRGRGDRIEKILVFLWGVFFHNFSLRSLRTLR